MKKLMLLLFAMIFLIGIVSAFEFDNVKQYNEEEKIITVKNSLFGIDWLSYGEVGIIQLINYTRYCIPGNCYAYYKLNHQVEDFGLKGSTYYNKGQTEILISKETKYEIYNSSESYEFPIYEEICTGEIENKTICELKNTKNETKFGVWNTYDVLTKLKEGNYLLREKVDVNSGETVDVVPNFYGLELTEWITFTGLSLISIGSRADTFFGIQQTNRGVLGNTFNMSNSTAVIRILQVSLQKLGSPIGDLTAYIWQTDGAPTYNVTNLVTNGSSLDASTIGSGSFAKFNFTFDNVELNFTQVYFIGLNASYTNSDINHIRWEIAVAGGTPTNTSWIRQPGTEAWYQQDPVFPMTYQVWGHSPILNLTVTLNSPINTFNTTNQTINFNGTVTSPEGITNVTLFIDGVLNETNSSGINNTDYLFTKTISEGSHNWTYESCNSGGCATATTRNFTIDSIEPVLNITEPFGVITFADLSINQTLKWNVSDINIDACLFQYEGVNTTVNCAANISNFTIGTARTLDFFANDTFGNIVSDTVTWSYLVLQTSTIFNASSFETAEERFTVNVTTNGSVITTGSLTFDGTENTGAAITNPVGNNYSITKSITIPASIGTKTHNFNLTLVEGIINTTDQIQIINSTNFTICGASPQDVPFINITFKNETLAQEDVNATISSTWTYSLSSLSGVNKTLTFTDAVQKLNYTFCFNPSGRPVNIDLTMTYNNDISQQRSFLLTTELSNIMLTQILFLLPTTDGLFSPFKTTNVNGDTITNVKAVITRIIGASVVTISSGFTDGSGFITFFLDPDETYTATFTKTPFEENTFSFTPTADLRNVIMGGEAGVISNGTEISRGLQYQIIPQNTTLANNTNVTFQFIVNSTDIITLMSLNITNSSNSELLFVSQASNGTITGFLDTGNQTQLIGIFTITTDNETITFKRIWIVGNFFLGDYSIFNQLTITVDNALISDFIRFVLILFTIISTIIFLTRKELTDTSESKVIVATLLIWAFSLVGWMDTGLISTSSSSGVTILSQFSNQFGVAIISTAFATFFIFRRVFIRKL